jgi:glycosyltransferase involved in cell wall biosynthesis
LQARKVATYEAALPRRFAGAAVTRPDDLGLLDQRYVDRAFVIPNGVDLPSNVVRAPVAGRLLFVGSFGHPPNLEGMSWFCERVLPRIRQARPDVSVDIAGRGPVPSGWERVKAESGVTFIESPADLAGFYARAAAVIAPIRLGHGTKLKVLEALAHRAPLIATTEATTGLPLVPSEHYLCADTADEFASQCLHALNAPDGLVTMAERAAAIADEFSWKRVGQSAFSALTNIVAKHSPRLATRSH